MFTDWDADTGLDTLLTALTKRADIKDMIGVSNNCGTIESGLGVCVIILIIMTWFQRLHGLLCYKGLLLNSGQLGKLVASYPGG